MHGRSLFHIVSRGEWQSVGDGDYRPASLPREGFVHCSFADQVDGPANALYRDLDELVVLELDPALLGAEVVVEDSYGQGQAYPHIYGPIPARAVVAVHPLHRDEAGDYRFTPGGASTGGVSSGGVTPGAGSAPASSGR